MVRNVINLLYREVRGLHEAAYLLGFFALASQILALVRDRILASHFGAGETLDVYYAAFRIPDLIFVAVASLVSFSVLIPFLADRLEYSEQAARTLLSSVFFVFLTIISLVSLAVYALAPLLLEKLFPGIAAGARFDELVTLTRVLLLQPVLLGLSNLFASVTQIHRKFLLYAVSPLLYNAGIIFGILVLYPALGISGLVWGVVLGAAAHLCVQLPFITRAGFLPRLASSVSAMVREAKEVARLSLPRTLALSAGQMVLLVLTGLASTLPAGSIAVFTLAFNLQNVPLTIIGASYSVAAFPTLARFFAGGERDAFLRHIGTAARHIIFWSLPVLVLFIVLRAQIVRVILGAGEFSWTDTRLTAAALALFLVSLTGHALVLLVVRGYYAAGKTLRPLIAGVCSAVCAVGFAYGLLKLFASSEFARFFIESLLRVEGIPGTEVLALPLGYALGVLVHIGILLVFFHYDFSGFTRVVSRTFWQSLSGAVAGGFVAYEALGVLDDVFDINTFIGIFSQGLGAGLLGGAVWALVLFLLGSREIREVWDSLHRKFWKRHPIAPEDAELQ